jgi:hypothetical protein
MNQLKTFLNSKVGDVKKLLDIEHSLNIVTGKLQYYKGTPDQADLTREATDLIEKYNSTVKEINNSFDFKDIIKEYITYQIKYKYENKHSDLNNTIQIFTKDLHTYINLVIFTLFKCKATTTVNMAMIDMAMIDNNNIFTGSINPKSVKKIESLIIDLNNLQQRWSSILKEEKDINEAEVTLARDATMWRKYKHLIKEINPNTED